MKKASVLLICVAIVVVLGDELAEYAVQLQSGANPDVIASRNGFLNKGPIGSLPNMFLFQTMAKHQRGVQQRANSLRGEQKVKWIEKVSLDFIVN